jgi:hypothetical protein
LISTPLWLVRDKEVGVLLRMNEISLTSCPAEVGLLIKLDSETAIELRLVVMVADALSGPSEPVPDAVALKIAALAGPAPSKSAAVVKAIADRDLKVLMIRSPKQSCGKIPIEP